MAQSSRKFVAHLSILLLLLLFFAGRMPSVLVHIMGVAGSGKTTVAKGVSEALGFTFLEADNFHSEANRDKMASGIPLTDADRLPWLAAIKQHIDGCDRDTGVVLACSALKKSYRTLLYSGLLSVVVVYLDGSYELLRSRMEKRSGHFMPVKLLQSQFDVLEIPSDKEMEDYERENEGGGDRKACRHLLNVGLEQTIQDEIDQVLTFVRDLTVEN